MPSSAVTVQPPRVVIDVEKVRHINCGLGRFSVHLAEALISREQDDLRPVLLLPRGGDRFFPQANVERMRAARWRRESLQQWVRPIVRCANRRPRVSLWHATNQMSRYLPIDSRVPVLLTIHDLNFLYESHRANPQQRIQRKLADMQRRIRRAVAVVTGSRFAADDISRHLDLQGRPLHVVSPGLAPAAPVGTSRPNWLPEGPFLLSLGNFLPHKNFHSLLDVVTLMPGRRLVIAGKNDTAYGQFLAGQIRQRGLESRVVMPGQVCDSDREWLYSHTEAFLFASLAEGFGFPVLEAMAAGRPVFISRSTSLPEIAGGHACFIDPSSADATAAAIRDGVARFDADPSRRLLARRHALSFSWTETARQYASLYQLYALA